jgi:AbrB family looped-hinge helix DNA binding protein
MASATKVGRKYQVVIPKSIREAAGLQVGYYMEADLTTEGILLRSTTAYSMQHPPDSRRI